MNIASSLTQNNALDELRKKREKWVDANRENNFEEGIKHLLTDLYPDNAHFIYELLQNAEDAGASEVRFVLNEDRVTFEHNGHRLFSLTDVDAITSIGFSTKKDDHTSIGMFGIGFKAVFAYTATPEIESGPFHFRIRDLVVPDTTNLFPGSLGDRKTRFVFPFDNPKKPPEKARTEIKENLRQLDANTLLFLSNICKIDYQFPDLTPGYLERKEGTNDKNRIEISTMHPGNLAPDSIHYLRFTKEVNIRDEDGKSKCCRIAVAFSMDKPENQDWKIKPLNGQVSIYFPTAKEPYNLRFHLHAPFASTVARSSVRQCPSNDELRNHIAELIAESMIIIREQSLLNVEFLATLPNDKDLIPPFYFPIQKRLIEEFNTNKLVPMKQGGHAAASEAYRGSRRLSDLINDEDLATLLEKDSSLPLWIANPPQTNQPEDNFLSMLDISKWTIEHLTEILKTESDQVMEWLKQKEYEWHQKLYAFLENFISDYESELSELRIVRCVDGEYRIGSECHFSSSDIDPDEDLFTVSTEVDNKEQTELHEEENDEENFFYVSNAVYSSGSNKNQQMDARKFLENIGVTEVNETERVKVILKQRYSRDSIKPQDENMKRFIDLVNEKPETKSIFKDYYIFEIDLQRDNKRLFRRPSGVFVDSPYLNTGLTAYFETIDEDSDSFKRALSPNYAKPESRVDPEDLGKFAESVGAQTKLEATKQGITSDNPQSVYLYSAPGEKESCYRINKDYTIREFSFLLNSRSIVKSNLIWRTMCHLPENQLEACYRRSQRTEARNGDSLLVHQLRNEKWVPQKEGDSISFVRPCNASIDNLPEGFPYETGQEWLEKIEFGKVAKQHQQKTAEIEEQERLKIAHEENEKKVQHQRAKDMGFNSAGEAGTMVEIANVLKSQGKSPDELRDKLVAGKRRKERILIEIEDAPEKEYEHRLRSVKSTTGAIDRRTHLRVRYTTDDNEMECQMCQQVMPFKKRNSDEDYFEAVEVLGKDHFPKEHEAQHLALCPECAAKYKEFVKRNEAARKNLYNLLRDSDVPEVSLQASGETIRIWFEEKHWNDLKTVLHYYENVYDSEDSTD